MLKEVVVQGHKWELHETTIRSLVSSSKAVGLLRD